MREECKRRHHETTLSSAWVQKQSAKPAVFPVSGPRSRNTIARDNWSAAHAFCIMAREHSLLSANVDKTLSRRLARAQSASEGLSSVPILFAWKTQNVIYEFLIKSISC